MNNGNKFRGVFVTPPAYYFLLDGSLSNELLSKVCDIINDVIALAVSIKGSSRISGFGVYYVGKSRFSSFPMQSLEFSTLHFALQDLKRLNKKHSPTPPCDQNIWKTCLLFAIKQYTSFMQKKFPAGWPPFQIVVISCKPLNNILQAVQDIAPSLSDVAIKRIQIIGVVSNQGIVEMPNVEKNMPDIPQFLEKGSMEYNRQNVIDSHTLPQLLEINCDTDTFELEKFFKSVLLDFTNDSVHLRILLNGEMVLHCDMQDVFINPESIIGYSNFRLATDIGNSSIIMPNRTRNSQKVPVYELEVIGRVPTYHTCPNSVNSASTIISPTTSTNTDCSVLKINKQHFSAVREELVNHQQLLITKSKNDSLSLNNVSCGYFGVFASSNKNIMFIKALGTKELLLPEHPLFNYEIPTNIPISMKKNASKCLGELKMYEEYNPLFFSSRLTEELTERLKEYPIHH